MEECVGACAVVIVTRLQRRRRIRRHRFWVREWLQRRESYGAYHQLLQELQLMDTSSYRNFLRMDSSSFEELLSKIAPKITFYDDH